MKFWRNLSLIARLSWIFGLICCVVFGCIGLLSYQQMQRIVAEQQDQALKARLERIELFLQDQQSFQILIAHPELYENMLGQEDNLLMLKNAQQTLISINPLQIQLPPLPISPEIIYLNNQPHNATTRLAYKTVLFQQQPYLLLAGKQLDEGDQILNAYLGRLLLLSLLGIVSTTLLARWAGQYLLRSLNALVLQTQMIHHPARGERLDIASSTLEVEQLRLAMNEMLAKIQASYEQLARFSEDIAHELRTPLNNLMGQTQIMLMQPRQTQELEQLLDSHLEEYERLKNMIDSMLFIARAEQSTVPLERVPFHVASVVAEVVEYFAFLAEERQMQIDVQISLDLQLSAHPDLFKRALSNLLMNAIDYGPWGGKILLCAQQSETDIHVEVLTEGVTIPENHLAHLFERFYQVDRSRHSKAQTGGLGLAIVASIMQLHHGQATVMNQAQGVVFRLTFPKTV